MPSVFENLSDQFYTAFFESDPDKRRAAIEVWIRAATPVLQAAVEKDIRTYVDSILRDTWTPDRWKLRAEKFNRPYRGRPFVDTYRLCLDVRLRPHERADVVVEALSPEVREKTIEAAKRALPEEPKVPARLAKSAGAPLTGTTDDDWDGDGGEDGRSPNDDRSDSMIPNHDAYQASMDNRSDQMNPNNDAYWSSRGS